MPGPAPRQPVPAVREYLAPRAAGPISVDGRLDEAAWRRAPWTEAFTDIEGPIRPAPRLRTRVRMLYDDSCWYIATELEEPDLWATITQRDAVIFHDNDFEVFVDPDGDTRHYAELELNALGTVWDLLLDKPYREGGKPDNAWTILGLRVAVALQGTLNHPGDRDRGWTVEIAIPWAAMTATQWSGAPPAPGTQWRVNFSRVEWDLRVEHGAYVKRTDPGSGKPLPEHNWVWSPQGVVNMHIPEMWGVVQFGGDRIVAPRGADMARPPGGSDGTT
jgi:hypothetical protein